MHHKLNTKKIKPFSEAELVSINKYLGELHRKYDENIPFSAVGLIVEADDFKLQSYVATQTLRGKEKYVNKSLPKNLLVAQNQGGVGYQNLHDVLKYWNTIVLPEAILLGNGKYWIIEGHHRTALQILAGRKEILFFVEKPKYKDKQMSIRTLQKEFATEIARNVHKDIETMVDKLFAAKDYRGLQKLIEEKKNVWTQDALKYAKNLLEDLLYALDRYEKYERANYTPEEVRKLCYSKQQLVKQRRKTSDPAKIKILDDKINKIKQHLDKAKTTDDLTAKGA